MTKLKEKCYLVVGEGAKGGDAGLLIDANLTPPKYYYLDDTAVSLLKLMQRGKPIRGDYLVSFLQHEKKLSAQDALSETQNFLIQLSELGLVEPPVPGVPQETTLCSAKINHVSAFEVGERLGSKAYQIPILIKLIPHKEF